MQIYKNVSFLPLERRRFGYQSFGVFDAHAKPMALWPLLTSLDSQFPQGAKTLKQRPPRKLKGRYIYAGAMCAYFGHLLTEGGPNILAVAQAIQSDKDADLLFHVQSGEDLADLRAAPAAAWFFEMAQLDPARITYITDPVTTQEVIIPEPAFTAKFRYAPHMAGLIDQAMARIMPGPAQKLYLSRTKWTVKGARILNELHVEDIFKDAGYHPVHLQDHSFEEQLAMVKGATALAGPQGSALHWSLYAPKATSVISLGWKSRLQQGICALRGQTYIDPRGVMPSPLRSPRTRIITDRTLRRAIARTEPL